MLTLKADPKKEPDEAKTVFSGELAFSTVIVVALLLYLLGSANDLSQVDNKGFTPGRHVAIKVIESLNLLALDSPVPSRTAWTKHRTPRNRRLYVDLG